MIKHQLPRQIIWDKSIEKEISFRPVQLETDFEMLYQWNQEPHVIPYWNLNISREAYHTHLTKFLQDPHHSLHIGLIDGVPMSYWETYWVKGDILENSYEYHPADQGVHLLIGDTQYLGKGYALPLLRAITSLLFENAETEKVVAEPNFLNKKMIHVFEKCGFQFQKKIPLPGKEAALLFCDRNEFRQRWQDIHAI
ncbi:RimJ/RimL family protein N-acetyltransferase [Croceifilum oryzae]|uniref:Lysine N-acyltransferase MbtK n=1 Tax=Croceifilum oryzae TaxID=1553429 RepID=A0AAJ1TIC4_9BACL|nr:GNAT family N-acetyltransferase [Croceifilum oryzae]MDQ0417472.1 RimJ/RimL family protein N-acetyltransferase [Croceifilum oryzae]